MITGTIPEIGAPRNTVTWRMERPSDIIARLDNELAGLKVRFAKAMYEGDYDAADELAAECEEVLRRRHAYEIPQLHEDLHRHAKAYAGKAERRSAA